MLCCETLCTHGEYIWASLSVLPCLLPWLAQCYVALSTAYACYFRTDIACGCLVPVRLLHLVVLGNGKLPFTRHTPTYADQVPRWCYV